MPWFAIRSIYLFGKKPNGVNVFEERIVAFEADNADAAHVKAKLESEQYAEANEMEVFPDRTGYEQIGEPLIDGYEVWSVLLESRQSLADFYAMRYSRYDYRVDE